MKTNQKTSTPAGQPVFHKVAENLYRLESSGGYYAFVKKEASNFAARSKPKTAN
jgi:hypothetical protein